MWHTIPISLLSVGKHPSVCLLSRNGRANNINYTVLGPGSLIYATCLGSSDTVTHHLDNWDHFETGPSHFAASVVLRISAMWQ